MIQPAGSAAAAVVYPSKEEDKWHSQSSYLQEALRITLGPLSLPAHSNVSDWPNMKDHWKPVEERSRNGGAVILFLNVSSVYRIVVLLYIASGICSLAYNRRENQQWVL